MKRRNLFLACLLLFVLPLSAARVDTLMVKSPSMNKEVQVLVVTPDVALGKNAAACPVLYLLHGYGGHAKTTSTGTVIDINGNAYDETKTDTRTIGITIE